MQETEANEISVSAGIRARHCESRPAGAASCRESGRRSRSAALAICTGAAWSRPQGMSCIVIMFRRGARMPALTLISLASVSCKSEIFPVLQEAFLRRAGFQGFCKKDFCLKVFYFLQISDIPYFARNASGRSSAGAGAARRRPDMTVGRQRLRRLLLLLIKVQS